MNIYKNSDNDPNVCSTIFRVEPLMSTMSHDVKNKELASLFECPVCFDYACPPILQCQSGHIVCANCRSKLSLCPTCRGPLENIRNLALEKLAMNVMFPCKYSSNGCSDSFPYPKKKQHEDICDFRPYMCPCPESTCRWMGQLDYVMPHLQQYHKNITSLEGEDIVFLATDITLPGAVDWVMMQSCFGHHFMLVLEKQERFNENRFYAIVRLIGTKRQAKQFAYRLELYNGRRRLTWDATPSSIHDSVQLSIANSDCLILDSSTAHVFAKNGNLGISVTIWHMNNSSNNNRNRSEINPSASNAPYSYDESGYSNTSTANVSTTNVGTNNQTTVVYPGYAPAQGKFSRNNNRTLPIPPPPLANPSGSPDCITNQTNLVVVNSNTPSNREKNNKKKESMLNSAGDGAGASSNPRSNPDQMDMSIRTPLSPSDANSSDGFVVDGQPQNRRREAPISIMPTGRPISIDSANNLEVPSSSNSQNENNQDGNTSE